MTDKYWDQQISKLPKRFELIHITPAELASKFQSFLFSESNSHKYKKAILDRLLDLTLREISEQSEFYRKRCSSLDFNHELNIFDLHKLPFLNRKEVEEADEELKLEYARFSFSSYTSGTTSGKPLMIDRCEQEERYLQQFFSFLYPNRQTSDAPLVLSLTGTHHGRVLQIPGNAKVFPVSLSNTMRLHQAIQVLKRTYTIDGKKRRITIVAGPVDRILKFSTYVASYLGDIFTSQLRSIHTGGSYLTKHNREWLENIWNCKVVDVYSITEFFSRASKCEQCGWYHFSPYCISEVVGYSSWKPIADGGRGRLVLSSLYPFTQMMPFIRYSPEDLVEFKKVNCPNDNIGYRFLGRVKTALNLEPISGIRDSFLSGGELYEILEPLPDIRRPARAPRLPKLCQGVGTLPVFSIKQPSNNAVAKIDIELTYPPALYPERAEFVRQKIIKGLIQYLDNLKELIESKKLLINLHPPETLEILSPSYRP